MLNWCEIGRENLLMVFLLGVLVSTVTTRSYLYGFAASLLSVLLFNYFFTEPYYTFGITQRQDYWLIGFFLLAALISGLIASSLRRQAQMARRNEQIAQRMYEVTESFIKLTGTERIAENALKQISEKTGCVCRIELDGGKTFTAPRASGDWAGPCLPILGVTKQLGEVMLEAETPLSPDDDKLVRLVINQMAMTLDREYIYLERERIRLAMEGERLKSTLLRSVSHDIRTPLTGIMGASNVIRDNIDSLSKEDIKRLACDIGEESAWLVMTVQNILQMTRFAEGRLSINADYEAVDDLLDQAAARVASFHDASRISVKKPREICLVKVDGSLFIQALVNLLDNAFKHAGDGAHILLSAAPEGDRMRFEVSDDGYGIDPTLIDHLFDGFTTKPTHEADHGRGVGLGLAICKACVEAHGGEISAENNPGGGACFTIFLPYDRKNTK